LKVAEELDEDEDMISISQIAMQLVDWTDPRRLVDLGSVDLEVESEETSMRNASIHVDVAIAIMTQTKKGSSIELFDFTDGHRGGAKGVV
jgi:hypothetical protein